MVGQTHILSGRYRARFSDRPRQPPPGGAFHGAERRQRLCSKKALRAMCGMALTLGLASAALAARNGGNGRGGSRRLGNGQRAGSGVNPAEHRALAAPKELQIMSIRAFIVCSSYLSSSAERSNLLAAWTMQAGTTESRLLTQSSGSDLKPLTCSSLAQVGPELSPNTG